MGACKKLKKNLFSNYISCRNHNANCDELRRQTKITTNVFIETERDTDEFPRRRQLQTPCEVGKQTLNVATEYNRKRREQKCLKLARYHQSRRYPVSEWQRLKVPEETKMMRP